MNVFQYYWHRTACFVTDVKVGISQLCHWTASKVLSNETVNFQASQFIEGLKTVTTFPFTTAKMIFDPPSRRLAAHVLEYNFLYYILPVLGYHGFLREHMKTLLSNTCGDYIFYVDILANAVFTRSLINAYAINIFNNMNASSIELPYSPASVTLNCSCKESQHIKAAIMSPIYYLTKMAIFAPLEYVPYVGTTIRYTLKPLAWGEALNEVNLSSLCHDHRAAYFATHNAAHYGMGIAVLASTQFASSIVTYYTGVSGFFIQDAIFNALYPFMIFHVHNQCFENIFLEDTPKDIFKLLRHKVEQGLTIGKAFITTLPKSDNNLVESLLVLTQKLKLRQTLLYPSLGKTPKQLVTFPPLHMLLRNNRQAILEKLETVEMVTTYPDLVKNFLFLYQWFPLLPPKEHARIIVGIMADNMEITTRLLAHAKCLIAHVESHDVQPDEAVRVRRYIREEPRNMMIESYMAPGCTHAVSQDSEDDELIATFHPVSVSSSDDDNWELIPSPDRARGPITPVFQEGQLKPLQATTDAPDQPTTVIYTPCLIDDYHPNKKRV